MGERSLHTIYSKEYKRIHQYVVTTCRLDIKLFVIMRCQERSNPLVPTISLWIVAYNLLSHREIRETSTVRFTKLSVYIYPIM